MPLNNMYKIVIVVRPFGENKKEYESGWWETIAKARAEAEYFMEKGEKPGLYQTVELQIKKAA